MTRLLLSSAAAAALASLAAPAGSSSFGGTSNGAYALEPFGARPAALGGAVVALPGDSSPFGGQPASLALLSPNRLSLGHATLLGGGSADVATFSRPIGSRTALSLGLASLRIPGIEVRSTAGTASGSFSDVRTLASLGLGTRATDRLAAGFAVKVAREQSSPGVAFSVVALDAGAIYALGSSLSLATAVRNVGLLGGPNRTDAEVAFGAALCPEFLRSCLVAEARATARGTMHAAAGVETRLTPWSALRLGWSERAWTAGVGLRLGPVLADYAVLVADPGTTHRATLSMEFGGFGLRLVPSVAEFSPAGEVKSVTYLVRGRVRSAAVGWTLSIRTAEGRIVRTLAGEGAPPENVSWDGRDDSGGLVPDGAYAAALVSRLASGDPVVSASAAVRVRSLSPGGALELRIR